MVKTVERLGDVERSETFAKSRSRYDYAPIYLLIHQFSRMSYPSQMVIVISNDFDFRIHSLLWVLHHPEGYFTLEKDD